MNKSPKEEENVSGKEKSKSDELVDESDSKQGFDQVQVERKLTQC